MVVHVHDPLLEQQLKADRQLTGADRFDEVWEGIYMMAPLADDEHQELQANLTAVFKIVVGWSGLGLVRAGVNVSDRDEDWQFNYRCPDVVVFLPNTKAQNKGSHWVGGPDFAVEILSPYDRSRDKLAFYSDVSVRELLLVDRAPWALELYRLKNRRLVLDGKSTLADPQMLRSQLMPLSFTFVTGSPRPSIEVVHSDGKQRWLV
jgi:Uma2 family endonuclease